MSRLIKHTIAILLCLMFILSLSLPMIRPVCAQSTKRSAPQFTRQVPNVSTMQLVIENQAFTNSESVNSIVYYYRVKDHNSYQWIRDGDIHLQSNLQTTLITIPPHPSDYLFDPFMYNTVLNNSTLLDFQVQAVTGNYSEKYVQGQMPGTPLQTDGYWETSFNKSETSNWSNTQTITIPADYSSIPIPNPTLTPSLIPTTKPNLSIDFLSNNLILTAVLSALWLITIILLVATYKRRKLNTTG